LRWWPGGCWPPGSWRWSCPSRCRRPRQHYWPVPTTRLAFDEFQRGTRESDETAIEAAFADTEWLAVNHGDVVQVVGIDGEVVEVELLGGGYAGRRVWLQQRHLTPVG
jgi:hypothetical protein